MCGIYGGVGELASLNAEKVLDHLTHRGPDGRGVWRGKEHVVLGHTRLSIIDLSTKSAQPMSDTSSNLTITFNGEIYNYLELRGELESLGEVFESHGDTEVILKAYKVWGEKCLTKLRGMFAFCIYDSNLNQLFAARDFYGIKPFLFFVSDDVFVFCSEAMPLVLTGLVPNQICSDGLSSFIEFGAVMQPSSIFKGLQSLMPGSYLLFDIESFDITVHKYYEIDEYAASKAFDTSGCRDDLREKLEKATRYHMVADVEVGAFLSGGIDSNAVTSLMKQYNPKDKIKTYTVGFDRQCDVFDESQLAMRASNFYDAEHHPVTVTDDHVNRYFDEYIDALDQPSIDGFNTFIVCREAAKDVKVILSGLGGDEIFGGYPHFRSLPKLVATPETFVSRLLSLLDNIRPNRYTHKYAYRGLTLQQGLRKLRRYNNPSRVLRKAGSRLSYRCANQDASAISQISIEEFSHYLVSTLLRDSDIMSMYHGLEVRPVLLDHELVEFGLGLPDHLKVTEKRLKACLVDSVRDLLPDEIIEHPKTGFDLPYARWMNGVLWSRCESLLKSSAVDEVLRPSKAFALRRRSRKKKLRINDWQFIVFFAWLDKTQAVS